MLSLPLNRSLQLLRTAPRSSAKERGRPPERGAQGDVRRRGGRGRSRSRTDHLYDHRAPRRRVEAGVPSTYVLGRRVPDAAAAGRGGELGAGGEDPSDAEGRKTQYVHGDITPRAVAVDGQEDVADERDGGRDQRDGAQDTGEGLPDDGDPADQECHQPAHGGDGSRDVGDDVQGVAQVVQPGVVEVVALGDLVDALGGGVPRRVVAALERGELPAQAVQVALQVRHRGVERLLPGLVGFLGRVVGLGLRGREVTALRLGLPEQPVRVLLDGLQRGVVLLQRGAGLLVAAVRLAHGLRRVVGLLGELPARLGVPALLVAEPAQRGGGVRDGLRGGGETLGERREVVHITRYGILVLAQHLPAVVGGARHFWSLPVLLLPLLSWPFLS